MEPTTALQTTGNDILQYQGNANLATGSGQADVPIPKLDLGGVESTINTLQQEEVQMRQQQYKQKIQEQKDLADTLASLGGGSAFNIKGTDGKDMSFQPLPQDIETLNAKADEIRKYAVNHKRDYATDPTFYKMMDDYKYHVRQASIRSVYASQAQAQRAQLVDPSEQAGLDANVKQNLEDNKLSDLKPINPYVPPFQASITPEILPADWISNPNYRQTFNETDKDGNPIVKTGLKNDFFTNTSRYDNPNTKGYQSAKKYVQSYYNHIISLKMVDPDLAKAEVNKFNTELDNNAASQKLPAPPHLADIDPTDGQVKFNKLGSNGVDGVPKAMQSLLLHDYGGTTLDTDNTLKAQKEHAEEADKAVSQKEKQYQLAETIRNDKEKNAIARAKLADKEKKDNPDDVNSSVSTVLQHMNDTRSKATFHDVNNFGEKEIATTLMKNSGLNLNEYKIAAVDKNDNIVQNISGLQHQSANGSYGKGVDKPEYAYYLKSKTGNPADDKYVVGYEYYPAQKPTDANPVKSHIEWKTITPQEAVGNTIKTRKNFENIDDKTAKNINDAGNKVNALLVQSNVNAPKPEPTESPDVIEKRLEIKNFKKKDGTIVQLRVDPVTGTRYPL